MGSTYSDVQHTVRLEHWSQHILHSHRRARVADEAGLLIELLGEEINTQVAVLTSLSRGGNANDLTWPALEDHNVADADEVAWNGHSVGNATTTAVVVAVRSAVRHVLTVLTWSTDTNFAVLDSNVFLYTILVLVVMMVVAAAVDWMQDAISSAVETLTERVILSLVVVIAHITVVLAVRSVVGTLGDLYLFFDVAVASGASNFTRVGASVLPAAGFPVLFGERDGAVTEVSLCDIDAGVVVDLSCWSVAGVVLAVYVDININVRPGRSTVASWQPMVSVTAICLQG